MERHRSIIRHLPDEPSGTTGGSWPRPLGATLSHSGETLSRRELLLGLVAGVALACGGVARPGVGRPDPVSRLIPLLAGPESAASVGRAYLALHPEERSLALLAGLLRLDAAAEGPDRRPQDLRRALSRRIRRDFQRGDVVRVRGWMLSRSEARVAAAAALLLDPKPGRGGVRALETPA